MCLLSRLFSLKEVEKKTGKRQNSSDVALVTFFADFPKSVAREVEPMSACMFSIFACFSYLQISANVDSVYLSVLSISFLRQLFQKLDEEMQTKMASIHRLFHLHHKQEGDNPLYNSTESTSDADSNRECIGESKVLVCLLLINTRLYIHTWVGKTLAQLYTFASLCMSLLHEFLTSN